jgi:hypothetical protein
MQASTGVIAKYFFFGEAKALVERHGPEVLGEAMGKISGGSPNNRAHCRFGFVVIQQWLVEHDKNAPLRATRYVMQWTYKTDGAESGR